MSKYPNLEELARGNLLGTTWHLLTAEANALLGKVEQLRTEAREVSMLLELGDQRLLASDGPCGGQNAAVALSAEESAELYQACQRIAAAKPTETQADVH